MQKNAFEWGSTMIPHSEDAIQVTQHVANFLVRLGMLIKEVINSLSFIFFQLSEQQSEFMTHCSKALSCTSQTLLSFV